MHIYIYIYIHTYISYMIYIFIIHCPLCMYYYDCHIILIVDFITVMMQLCISSTSESTSLPTSLSLQFIHV